MGVDLIQIKHGPRVSREDRRRNQRFQRNLLNLIDSAHMQPADVVDELQEEEVAPAQHDTREVPKVLPGECQESISGSSAGTARRPSKLPEVPSRQKERLEKLKVYFTAEDLQLLENVSAARGQRPDDFVRLATLKMFAELGVVDGERKRLLLLFT